MSQETINQTINRRLRQLALEYHYFSGQRGGLAGGRKAFFSNAGRALYRGNWRWWSWEWHWWWLQRDNHRWRPKSNRAEADRHLVAQLDSLCQSFFITAQSQSTAGFDASWSSGGVPGLVSIVMPVYNHRAFVVEAIESVVNQTYPGWELIIVDDGSTDQLDAVLGPYRGHDRIAIFHRPHLGLPAALNFGFEQARGEFLTWTSADNGLLPTNLERLVDFLNRRPDVQLVYSNYLVIDERGEPYRRFLVEEGKNVIPPNSVQLTAEVEWLNVQNNFIGASFLYRRLLGQVVGPYADLMGVEDYDFWMRANRLFKLAHLDSTDCLYRYRFHTNSLTGADGPTGQIYRRVKGLQRFDTAVRQPIYARPCLVLCHQPSSDQDPNQDPNQDPDVIMVRVVTIASSADLKRLPSLIKGERVVIIADVRLPDWVKLVPTISNYCDWMVVRGYQPNQKISLSDRVLVNAHPQWHSPFIRALVLATVINRQRQAL